MKTGEIRTFTYRGKTVIMKIIRIDRDGILGELLTDYIGKNDSWFLMVRSKDYFFDIHEIRDKSKQNRWGGDKLKANGISTWNEGTGQNSYREREMSPNEGMKNPGDVADFWNIPTKPSNDSHYAQYNDELLKKPILAGCPEFVCNKCGKPREKIIETKSVKAKRENFGEQPTNHAQQSSTGWEAPEIKIKGLTDCGCNAGYSGGIVYDPFMGSGTTALIALRTNRHFIGSEMSKEYLKIANDRIQPILNQTKLF